MNYIFADTYVDSKFTSIELGLKDWGMLHSPHLVGPQSIIWIDDTASWRVDYESVLAVLRLRGASLRPVPRLAPGGPRRGGAWGG